MRRLVVVGAGMASVRLVEELVARGAVGGPVDGDGWAVTVVGEEPVPAYNRILLSAVLDGSHRLDATTLRDASWYAEHGVALRLGTRVLAVDRDAGEVVLVDGSRLPFDRLVLATGAIPTLPPIRGLVRGTGELHPAVHAFRTRADLLGLLAALPGLLEGRDPADDRADDPADDPARAVVVGGGLLGLQVARALSLRGVATEVVEGAEHLLSSQVGPAAGAALRRRLRSLGTTVYTGTRATRLDASDDPAHPDRARLRLDVGAELDADLVVLCAGGRPSVALARAAGLAVRRGVVVDDALTSPTDPRVHALGDCAQHGDRTTGFVAPAWEQASLLAARLAGEEVTYEGTRTVARLRAPGLDVAVLGDPEHAEGEVVEVANPVAGTHRKLVVRDGVVVAGALVGDLSRVGLLTQLYDRRTVLGPAEPGELLLGERRAVPAALPDDAEVCACSGATAGAVRSCGSFAAAVDRTRATTGCGGCADAVRALLAGPARAEAPTPAFSRP